MAGYGALGVVPLGELVKHRLQRSVAVATPAAGAELSQVVPAGKVWEILSLFAIFTTSAVVANRNADLRIQNSDGTVASAVPPLGSQAASLQGRFYWSAMTRSAWTGGSNKQGIPVPAQYALTGQVLVTSTVNLDVGDQWSGIVLNICEWSVKDVENQLLNLRQFVEAQASADRIAGH